MSHAGTPAGSPARRLCARLDPTLHAVLGPPRPLLYSRPEVARDGLPPNVRAGSALRRQGAHLVVVQDDVDALALITADGTIEALPLPPRIGNGGRVFDKARGNKRFKMDLEACAALGDGRLLAFGSGSSDWREHVVVVAPAAAPRVLHAPGLYAALRACTHTLGAALNLEGAVSDGRQLWLLQRGNDAGARDGAAANAIIALSLPALLAYLDDPAAVPAIESCVAVDLGAIDGIPLGFTDAALAADGRLAFLACAEDSSDVQSDGPVLGCRFGWLDGDDLRCADVRDADGRPTALKLEGLEPRPGDAALFDVVADMDRGDEPAVIAELRVSG